MCSSDLLDNDGDQDLVAAIYGGVAIADNDGAGRFAFRDVIPTSEDLTSLAAADVDSDGDLDLYACAYGPDALTTGRINTLLRNPYPTPHHHPNSPHSAQSRPPRHRHHRTRCSHCPR